MKEKEGEGERGRERDFRNLRVFVWKAMDFRWDSLPAVCGRGRHSLSLSLTPLLSGLRVGIRVESLNGLRTRE